MKRSRFSEEMGFSDREADCKLLFGISMFLPALWFSWRLTLGRRMLAFGTWVEALDRHFLCQALCIILTSGLCRPWLGIRPWGRGSLRWGRHNQSASRNARSCRAASSVLAPCWPAWFSPGCAL